MAVRVLLSSGERRIVEAADAARERIFFEITQKRRAELTHTVLTLRASDVVGAEIVKDGKVVDYVVGGAGPSGLGTAQAAGRRVDVDHRFGFEKSNRFTATATRR